MSILETLEGLKDLAGLNAAKKQKTSNRDMGGDPLQLLANRLLQIRHQLHEKMESRAKGSVVEIEARLGMIVNQECGARVGPFTPGAGAIEFLPAKMVGKRFASGVSKKHFYEYERFLIASTPESQVIKTEKKAYIYRDGRRVEKSEDGEISKETKFRELEFQMHMPACPYDFRISVSIETPVDGGSSEAEFDSGWESCRTKHRSSFRGSRMSNNEPCQWQIDLTRVDTEKRQGGITEVTYEVEFELGSEDTARWVQNKEEERAKKDTGQVSSQVLDVLTRLMPAEKTASSLAEIRDNKVVAAARHAAMRAFDAEMTPERSALAEFPGTMPVGFSRRTLEKVLREDYFVSEKTDGVRYFLVVVDPSAPLDVASGGGGGGGGGGAGGSEGGGACRNGDGEGGGAKEGKVTGVLLDRKFKGFTMEGLDLAVAGLGHGTVVDGEVVRNRSWQRDVFMAFDVMACSAKIHPAGKWASVCHEPFKKRLGILQGEVLNKGYRKGSLGNQEVHGRMAAVPLILKFFHPAQQVGEVLRHIGPEGPDRVYLERDKATGRPLPALKRHHKSDGLIFAPNGPYQRGTDPGYLKWKWPDCITLDFLVTVPRPSTREAENPLGIQVTFPAQGCDGVDFTEHVTLDEHERYRLFGDLAAADGHHGLIAEWEYDPECAAFRYKMPRPDKKKANFSRTVLATLMELAEAIDVEELQYRLSRKGKEDDWADQLSKFRQKLVRGAS